MVQRLEIKQSRGFLLFNIAISCAMEQGKGSLPRDLGWGYKTTDGDIGVI